jgi:uncharacterized membrane protein YqjE
MDSDAPVGLQTSKQSAGDSVRNWIAALIGYFELRLQLIGLEAKETGTHLLVLALLFVGTIVFFAGSLVMLVVFLLFLMMLVLHWDWGWCALASAAFLLLLSVSSALVLRLRIVRPIFPVTLAELKKDREWLSQKTKSSG